MNEQEALARMIAPGTRRPGKYRDGVIQIWITRACDKACFGCTQGSNLGGRPGFITPDQLEVALKSLQGYFGVAGCFGGNPALHPEFEKVCALFTKYIPYEQRGIWCNHPKGHGTLMRKTFNPAVSNINVHLDKEAAAEFHHDWPEVRVVGLNSDSRHSPPYVAMKDVIDDESKRWELISDCDINKHWSAMIGVFRNQVRAWFCEIAGAQAMLHQDEPDYPDTGLDPAKIYLADGHDGPKSSWWQLPMFAFASQVKKHCHDCGVPIRGYGELSQAENGVEQTSATHANVYRPKRKGREVQVLTKIGPLKPQSLERMTNYLGNAQK